MHEYSIIEALLRRVDEEARARQAIAVHGVRVGVGELAGVEPDLLVSAYEIARAGTRCERAVLHVERYPIRWSCPACGRAFARGEVLRCAACGEPARLDPKSEALVVESIEMEVP